MLAKPSRRAERIELQVMERRQDERKPAEGQVVFFLHNPDIEIRGSLLDVSPDGFRAAHQHTALCAGQQVTFHRSEEHTSELQSQSNLVCRLLLEKKKNKN